MVGYYSTVCMDHILFIPSSVEERVGCFDFLAIMSNAAVNIYVEKALIKRMAGPV